MFTLLNKRAATTAKWLEGLQTKRVKLQFLLVGTKISDCIGVYSENPNFFFFLLIIQILNKLSLNDSFHFFRCFGRV